MSRKSPTNKQLLFIKEYLKDLNATQAAIRSGYSVKTADKIGPELLGKTSVAKEIQKAMAKRQERLDIQADDILGEIAKIAFGDMRQVAKWDGEGFDLIGSAALADRDAALINQIKFTKKVDDDGDGYTLTTALKLNDKLAALELLGRHINLWKGVHGGNEDPREPHVKTVLDAIRKLSEK